MAPPKKQCSPEERVRLDRLAAKRRQHRLDNPDQTKIVQDRARKKFYKHNAKKVMNWNIEMRKKKKKEYRATERKRRKLRRTIDSSFVVKDRLRARFRSALKRTGNTKMDAMERLCGCSLDTLHAHLQLKEGEVIDHIWPFRLFDLSTKDGQERVMHWSNMQPLTDEENRSKGTRLPTKAMADRALQAFAWPDRISYNDLPDIYEGWATPLRMR